MSQQRPTSHSTRRGGISGHFPVPALSVASSAFLFPRQAEPVNLLLCKRQTKEVYERNYR